MSIIVTKNGNNSKKLDQKTFGLEDQLQDYVKNNPDIVPIYEIKEDARLLVLAREFSTKSGPIDALGIDQDGNIYVIETKLYKNADKRTVVAQALDYGASLWRHSGDATSFIEDLNNSSQKYFNLSLEEKLNEFFNEEDPKSIIDSVSKNVSNGDIKYVILMDQVEDRLKDLITYVNQNSRFDIYAVDLEYYKHESFEIIIPRLYGSEVKKTVGGSDDSNRIDYNEVISWIEESGSSDIYVDREKTTKAIIKLRSKFIDSLLPMRDDKNSSWANGASCYYEIKLKNTGRARAILVLNSQGVSSIENDMHKKIVEFSGKTPRNTDWKWFTIKHWTPEHDSIESIEKDIKDIFSNRIPEFESKLRDHINSTKA